MTPMICNPYALTTELYPPAIMTTQQNQTWGPINHMFQLDGIHHSFHFRGKEVSLNPSHRGFTIIHPLVDRDRHVTQVGLWTQKTDPQSS